MYHIVSNIENLIFYRASLQGIIEKRIGLEAFTDKLSQVPKHESYTRAIKKPHINYKQPNEVVFDFEFTRLFKGLESEYFTNYKGYHLVFSLSFSYAILRQR